MNEKNVEVTAGSNTPNTNAAEAEKVLKQSEVNEIVGRVKHDAYTKGKQDAMSELQRQQPPVQQPAAQPIAQPAPTMGGIAQPAYTREDAQKDFENFLVQNQQKMHAQNVAQQYLSKMQAGKSKYSDFDDVVNSLQAHTMPEIVDLANHFDNTDDIMYDLGKNPTKLATLRVLGMTNPQLAAKSMNELSMSIKANKAAQEGQSVNEPLSQIKPSNVGADNGSNTIADLRKKPWLKA